MGCLLFKMDVIGLILIDNVKIKDNFNEILKIKFKKIWKIKINNYIY